MHEILSPHWLSTILEIVCTVFIFLLGLPFLISHIFLPEEVRDIYNKKMGAEHLKDTIYFFYWVLAFLIFFCNHFLKGVIETYFPKDLVEGTLITYNLLTLIAFIIFFIEVNIYIKNFFFSKNNHSTILLLTTKSFEGLQNKNSSTTKPEYKEELMDIVAICHCIKTRLDSEGYIKEIEKYVKTIIAKDYYTGEELEKLIQELLSQSILENKVFHNYTDLNNIFRLLCYIIQFQQDNLRLKKVDSEKAKECLKEIGKLANKLNLKQLFSTLYSKAVELENANSLIFELSKESNRSMHSRYIAGKGKILIQNYITYKKMGALRNGIAIFSWLYAGNDQMKQFVTEQLKSVINEEITKGDFLKVQKSFYDVADFYTADLVQKLYFDLYTK